MFDFTLFLLTTTLLLLPLPCQAQTISINGSLTLTATETSSTWRSSNGDFAFGFQRLQSDPNLFVLAIWFDKIPLKTIVWYETSSYPVPRGSTLQVHARDGLLLRDPQGSPLYTTTGPLASPVAQAFMQDNGNFVLTATNSSNILWESFRHPSDTILPSQTIEIDEVLVSRKTPVDLGRGRFRARMNGTGNFVFRFKTIPSSDDYDALYYSSQTSNDNNASDSGFRVRFDETASVSVETRDGRSLTTLSIPSKQNASQDYYYRASLDHDGIFTVYYHPKTSVAGGDQRWSVEEVRPRDANDICRITAATKGSGACGYNSMCAVVGNGRPECECAPGFSPVDPDNMRTGCKSDYSQNCIVGEAEEDECSLIEIRDANWPMYDYEYQRVATEQECRDACLRDYLCGAAVLGPTGCWKKSMPIANGRYDQGTKTFLKRGKMLNQTQNRAPAKPEGKKKKDSKVLIIVGSLLLGSSVLINLFFAIAAAFFPRIKLPVHNQSNLRCFTYKELVQATNGFREELGRGGFGTVYKGNVTNSDGSRTTSVAVKKLDRIVQDSDDKEFTTEVSVIGQIHHRNVVRLLGFCNEGPNRLLVYEHMTKGNLATFLFDTNPKPSWRERTRIAVAIARGLAYLHEECSTQIIHCDIKPQNILLDECCTPKISDFGLAKLLMLDQSKTVTNIRGTKGYVSPEWFRNAKITSKVDVYSFGVVLLEMITCRKSVADVENPILSEWCWQCYVEGKVEALVEGDDEALGDGGTVERFVKVGLWCVEEDAELRPSMRRVCEMLQGTVEVGVPPFMDSSFTYISTHL